MTFNKPLPEFVVSHNLNGSFRPVKSVSFVLVTHCVSLLHGSLIRSV